MKNTENREGKTKHIARIMLLILLLSSAINLAGCDMEYKYLLNAHRYSHDGNYSPGHFVATSNKTIFNKNDITFNIAYATHQIQESNPKESYPNNYGNNPIMYFGVYICPKAKTSKDFWEFENYQYTNIYSLQNIDGYTFVNGITDEQAFTNEYALIPTPFFISDGSIYNHTEDITIPPEYITEKYGAFVLKFICFCYSEKTNSYQCIFVRAIDFNYEELDDNTVKIKFEKKNFMLNEL